MYCVILTGDVDVDVFDENNVEIPTKLTDNGDFTYRVDFEPFTVGSYHYEFFIDDQKVSDTNNEICVKLNMIDTREREWTQNSELRNIYFQH